MVVAIAPVLLVMANYFYGTLAAVRSLGRSGVPVTLADPNVLAPACWSRHVRRRLRCPGALEVEQFLTWLLDFGKRHPGHVLLPTSDDTAWIYAAWADELSRYFRLSLPSVHVLNGLLNKGRLHEACLRLGIDVPGTWWPVCRDELREIAPRLEYPVLVKPASQALQRSHGKGACAVSPDDLESKFDLVMSERFAPAITRFDPAVRRPLVQRFHAEAERGIYNIAGFVAPTGEILGMRASRKVLQRPRRLGIGLCFEAARVREDAAASLQRLILHTGYHGVFEAEFIQVGERLLLIDFNPRFYGQMGFEIARGLDLPRFAYAAAVGDQEELARATRDAAALERRAEALGPEARHVYTHRVSLEMLLVAQRLGGVLSKEEVREWRAVYTERRSHCTDAALDREDWLPGVMDAAQHLWHCARHPRSFLRVIALNR